LENTTGAYRTSTVSITKYQLEHMYMGDAKNEMEMLFNSWMRQQGKRRGFRELLTNEGWNEFNDQIFRYREGVRNGIRVVGENESPLIKRASELLTKQYDMMRRHQQAVRVSGFGNLPSSSEGYQPWDIRPNSLTSISSAKLRPSVSGLWEEVRRRCGWVAE